MRLVAPFNPVHLNLREIAGVGISIRREDALSVVETDHPNAIRALRRYGFAEPPPMPLDPAEERRAWAREVVTGTATAVREASRRTDDPERIEALLQAETEGPNRSSVRELLSRRVRNLRDEQGQNTSA